MMKQKISMNRIPADKIYRCGYCDLQNLLWSGADYYNAGIYGWNCDIYMYYYNGKSIAICTGYRNMRGERIPSELICKYDEKAKEIRQNHNFLYDEMCNELNNLMDEFFEELAGR